MKKTLFAICCSVMISGFSFAQDAAPTPDTPAPVAAAEAAVVEAVDVTAVPAAQEAVQAVAEPVIVNALPGEVLNQGVIIDSGVPVTEGQVVEGGQMEYAPTYVDQGYGQSVMSTSVAPTTVEPAPVATYNAPAADPFAATACNTCDTCGDTASAGRRGILRSVTTRGRSMFTRVRGVFGRRR